MVTNWCLVHVIWATGRNASLVCTWLLSKHTIRLNYYSLCLRRRLQMPLELVSTQRTMTHSAAGGTLPALSSSLALSSPPLVWHFHNAAWALLRFNSQALACFVHCMDCSPCKFSINIRATHHIAFSCGLQVMGTSPQRLTGDSCSVSATPWWGSLCLDSC